MTAWWEKKNGWKNSTKSILKLNLMNGKDF